MPQILQKWRVSEFVCITLSDIKVPINNFKKTSSKMYYFQGLYSLQNSYLYLIPVSFYNHPPSVLLLIILLKCLICSVTSLPQAEFSFKITTKKTQFSKLKTLFSNCSTSMTCRRRIFQEATPSCSRAAGHLVNSLNLLFDHDFKSFMFKKQNKKTLPQSDKSK